MIYRKYILIKLAQAAIVGERWPIRIPVGASAILTEIFGDFLKSL
jgi:hypothetical protein